MMVSISNAVESNYIFIGIFLVILLISIRRRKDMALFPSSLTTELKGFAILAIFFSHVGYFLVNDHRFLFPLSIMAGVGVEMFLFLSAFGLTLSTLRKSMSVLDQYRHRLFKIFLPFWLAISFLFTFDFFFLHIFRSWTYVLRSYLGFFPHADIFVDLNSPLWYFTFILFYYLLFPLVFSRRWPCLSAILLYLIPYFILKSNPIFLENVAHLYRVHIIAFPLGILWGSFLFGREELIQSKISSLKNILKKEIFFRIFYWAVIIISLAIFVYTAYYSNVGQEPWREEMTSLITVAVLTLLAMMKRVDFRLFYLFGFYSYEIYLLHMPILARYDFFFLHFSAWLATISHLVLVLIFSWGLSKLSTKILRLFNVSK